MAASVYENFSGFIEALTDDPPLNRRSFLRQVRFATITNMPGEGLDREYVLSAGCAIAWGWIARVTCPTCNTEFSLGKISRSIRDDRERYVGMLINK